MPADATADGSDPFASLAKDYDGKVRPDLEAVLPELPFDRETERRAGPGGLRQARGLPARSRGLAEDRRGPRQRRDAAEGSRQLSAAERSAIRGWVRACLDAEAAANAGDPGAVVMRRLTNVEYDNSVRDLTGVDLRPAREFPADAAAGEGFTNVGDALVMSPSMLDKYLAAAKGIAAHAVLLPDGFRFSEKTTRPDWSEEILTEIKRLYREYTDPRGSTRVNLQGLRVGHQFRRTHPAREVPGGDH